MESSESDQDPQSSSEEEDDNIYYLHLPDDMNPQTSAIETLSLQELRQMSFQHSPDFIRTKKQAELQEMRKSKIPDYFDTNDNQVLYCFYRSVNPVKKQEWNFERSRDVMFF